MTGFLGVGDWFLAKTPSPPRGGSVLGGSVAGNFSPPKAAKNFLRVQKYAFSITFFLKIVKFNQKKFALKIAEIQNIMFLT